MKKTCLHSLASALLLFGGVTPASAAPIISVDMVPGTAGIQSTLTVVPTTTFAVDVVISGVDAASPLNGFEFDLDFDPAILTATSVIDGGFLLPPVLTVESDITAPDVNFAEVTLAAIGAVGDGVLATIAFDAIAVGTSPLDLNDVILAAPFGVPITVAAVNDGSVTVTPEPGTLLLLGSGIVGLGISTRRRNRRK